MSNTFVFLWRMCALSSAADICHWKLIRCRETALHVRFFLAAFILSLGGCAGVAVRSGHHCTQPLHRALGIAASARASPYLYNTQSEIDSFIEALQSSIKFFTDMDM